MLRRRLSSFTAAAVVFLPLTLVACGSAASSDPRAEPPLVRAAVAQATSASSRTFSGVVAARVQSDLGFRVPGKVVERLVDAGQLVKRGQPLMRIDATDLNLAARAQQEAVAAARARAKQTTEDEIRYRDLPATGAISASTYEQIKAAADSATAQLSAAEAQADASLNASRYAELVADGDGVVMETWGEPGQVVGAGQVVVRLAHAGSREAIIQLPETLRPEIGSTGRAALFGHETVSAPARLRQLSGAADRLTRTFEARYVLEGDLANAPLGATVRLSLADEKGGTGGVQVPLGSLFDAGKGPGVWIIGGDPATVSWRPVVVRSLLDDGARVEGRIAPGDRVVALGAHLLREGEPVRVAGAAVASVRP